MIVAPQLPKYREDSKRSSNTVREHALCSPPSTASWPVSPNRTSKGMCHQKSWVRASQRLRLDPPSTSGELKVETGTQPFTRTVGRQDAQACFSLKALDSVFIGMSFIALSTPPYSNSAKTDSDFQLYYLSVISMLLSPFLLFALGS